MKKCISIVVVVLLLYGCSNESEHINKIISLRNKINSSNGCEFTVAVTLDYGEALYTFFAECRMDGEKNIVFTVLEPSSIAGIRGKISDNAGALTFDNEVLAFNMIADGQITPICTPWLLMEALCGGYINSCGVGDSGIFARIDDSFCGTEFSVDVWLDDIGNPSAAEMVWEGKRIVSMVISDFVFV